MPKRGAASAAEKGAGVASFFPAMPNLQDPEAVIGQTLEVPGYYWNGGDDADRSQIFRCEIVR
jgi:hypothetical protein